MLNLTPYKSAKKGNKRVSQEYIIINQKTPRTLAYVQAQLKENKTQFTYMQKNES